MTEIENFKLFRKRKIRPVGVLVYAHGVVV